MESHLAPIVLFVYNRPEHTRRTLESLAANPLSAESVLHVYADGPKEGARRAELDRIARTREVLRERDWCAQVEVVEQAGNKGLAASIVDGVTEVIDRHGKVIVLEDDLVLSPGFLAYMNSALDLYAGDAEVMQISSYLPMPAPTPAGAASETFFLRGHETCWGWATWKRSWDQLETDATRLRERVYRSGRLDEFTWGGSCSYLTHLEQNIRGEIATWAIKWHATVFLRNGLCLYPSRSLVHNIGLDGSGIHSGVDFSFRPGELATQVQVGRIPLAESPAQRTAFATFYRERQRRAAGRFPWRQLKRCVPGPARRRLERALFRRFVDTAA